MRSRLAAVVLATSLLSFLPTPSRADAVVPPTVTARLHGLAGHGQVSAATRTPIAFSLLGFDLPARGEVEFRTSADGGTWTGWEPAEPAELEEGPDLDSHEAARDAVRPSEPVWVGEARYLQVRTPGASPSDVGVHLVDGRGLSRSLAGRVIDRVAATLSASTAPADAADRPPIVTRKQWGADESLRNGAPRYATPRYAVLHHTAGRNEYTREEAPAIVRSIYAYHTKTRGWDDIGYNFLVDRYGTIYEGRAGGMDRGVVGAHAAGFNSGSIGVSVIGNFTTASAPQVAQDAALAVTAWKQQLHGIDPAATITVTSGGSPKYPKGEKVTIPTLIGHRDVGSTSCPGDTLYARMPWMRGVLRDGATTAPEPPPPSGDGEAQPAPEPEETSPFVDTAGDVHAADIDRLWREGIAAGCTDDRFCPGRKVTRGQIATFLVRARPDLEPLDGQRFDDVPEDHTHAGAINAVDEAGLLGGYPDGTFRPDAALSRAQMAVVLQRALRLELVWGQHFDDVPMSETYARPRINAIHRVGVASGCTSSRYCPADAVTRGQMATFLVRSLDRGL